MTPTAVLERPDTTESTLAPPKVAPPTRQQLLVACANALVTKGQVNFGTLLRIEHELDPAVVRAMETCGTAFTVVDQVLAEHGTPTDGTVGGLMDSPLQLSMKEVHYLACSCNGQIVTGEVAAIRYRNLARWPS